MVLYSKKHKYSTIFSIILTITFGLLTPKALATEKNIYATPITSISELGYVSNGSYFSKNQDKDGNLISLNNNGSKTTYQSGIITSTKSVITYSGLKKYSYDRFQSIIGIHTPGEIIDSQSTVKFQIYAGKKLLYESQEMTTSSNPEYVDIDIKNEDVIQLVTFTTDGSNGILTAWADAIFSKSAETPILEVSDLEFSSPDQVTKENILEYAKASSADGSRDLTSNITYKTDYKDNTAGEYSLTYSVKDPFNNNVTSKTVILRVLSTEKYKLNLSDDELTRPLASYLYHGRGSSSYQAQQMWDAFLSVILNYNNSDDRWPTINKYGEVVVPVTLRLQDLGIYVSKEEVHYLNSHLMDDEPRTFNVKDWSATYTLKDGIIDTVTIYLGNSMIKGDSYIKMLRKINENTTEMFKNIQSDMTEAQMLKSVASTYSKWLKYGGGQLLSDSLGNGMAVCGGNARGYIYLMQRMGIKSYWVRTISHAWSHSRVGGNWYRTDLLANMYLKAEPDGAPHHPQVYLNRHLNWVPLSPVDYPQDLLNYKKES